MTGPTVSVVIPTRDRARLLRKTVASVLAQQGVDLEVVVVDDGSAAEDAAAARALSDDRVTVLHNTRSRGGAAARNQGLGAAAGRWVAFTDDDDLWTPRKLTAQLGALFSTGRRWAYSGAVKFEEGPRVWQVMPAPAPEVVRTRLPWKCVIPAGASNVLAEGALLAEVDGFDEGLAHLADWDLWLRLLEVGPPAAVEAVAVAYRLHPGAMSLRPQGLLEELAVLDQRYRHLRDGAALDPGPTHLWIAMSWLRAGARPRAAAAYLRAARTRPRHGLRGLARTLHPAPPRPAHVLSDRPDRTPRLKRVQQVALAADMAELLAEHASPPAGRHGLP